MATRIDSKGLRDLGKAFATLNADVQQKTARAATSAGATVFKKRIKALAPVAAETYKIEDVIVQPGNIGRNVVVKRVKPSETTATSEHLVVVRGKQKYGYASRVAALQEFGTVENPPKPFFRPGAAQAAEEASNAVRERFGKRIQSAIDKLSTK